MSKGTYSYSNRHRMHETNQTPAWMDEHEVKAREITPEHWKTLCDIEEPVAVMVSGKQMTELMKDKERLDWLFKNNATEWVYTKEDIDKVMNQQKQ
jgi:hypothetical protein